MQTELLEECGGSEPPATASLRCGLCSPTPQAGVTPENAVEEEIPQCVMTLHFRLVLRNKKSGVGECGDGMVIVGSHDCLHLSASWGRSLHPLESSVSSLRNQSTSPLTQITEKL